MLSGTYGQKGITSYECEKYGAESLTWNGTHWVQIISYVETKAFLYEGIWNGAFFKIAVYYDADFVLTDCYVTGLLDSAGSYAASWIKGAPTTWFGTGNMTGYIGQVRTFVGYTPIPPGGSTSGYTVTQDDFSAQLGSITWDFRETYKNSYNEKHMTITSLSEI